MDADEDWACLRRRSTTTRITIEIVRTNAPPTPAARGTMDDDEPVDDCEAGLGSESVDKPTPVVVLEVDVVDI